MVGYLHICTVFDPKVANVYQDTALVNIMKDGLFQLSQLVEPD